MLVSVDPETMEITDTINIPDFGADYDNGQFLFGPQIALQNGVAYITNGANRQEPEKSPK